MQIGDDHNWKLQPLRLMNRHQSHRVGRVVDLPFTLATASLFEFTDEANEIANVVGAGTLVSFRKREQLLYIRQADGPVEVRCRDYLKLRSFDRESEKLRKTHVRTTLNQIIEKLSRAIKRLTVLLINRIDRLVNAQSVEERTNSTASTKPAALLNSWFKIRA